MNRLTYLIIASALVVGCSRSTTPTYSDRLTEIEKQFGQVYANGTVREVETALHVYLARLNGLQMHPDCPEGKELHFALLRGLAEARLARLHGILGHPEKEAAFVAAALTHVADEDVNTKEALFEMVERFDGGRPMHWKQELTQPEN